MLRLIVVAVVVWLTILTVLTLIAIFRHSSSQHSERPPVAAAR